MIYVVSHKFLELPELPGYRPLFVGAERLGAGERLAGWSYDDCCVDGISALNATYCELTGLKWIAEKGEGDILGLVHYRRFLASPADPSRPLSEDEARGLLASHDVLAAMPVTCVAFGTPVTVAQHYRQNHSSSDLSMALEVIDRRHPTYALAARRVLMGGEFRPFNMLVCKREAFQRYASWLFSVLDPLRSCIDLGCRDAYQARVFGFLAERLFGVWAERNRLDVLGLPVINPLDGEKPFVGEDAAAIQFPKPDVPAEVRGFRPVRDGVDYSTVFDAGFYLAHNGDVAAVFGCDPAAAFGHWFRDGVREGRQAHPRFSIHSYANGNPALRERFDSNEDLLKYYLQNPRDGKHPIGYENFLATVDHEPCRALLRAEKRGVID